MAGSLNGKTGALLQWIVVVLGSVIAAYYTAQNTTNERLTKVETRWEAVQHSLTRIENRLDERDREQRALFNDWLNGVNRRTLEPLPLQSAIDQGKR